MWNTTLKIFLNKNQSKNVYYSKNKMNSPLKTLLNYKKTPQTPNFN